MSRARPLLLVLAAAVVVAALAWVLLLRPSGQDDAQARATAALTAFTAAWSRGDDAAAAAATDAPGRARTALAASRRGLDGAGATVRAGGPITLDEDDDDVARARIGVRWDVPGFGPWTSTSRVTLGRIDGTWKVRWRPTVIHPRLTAATRLGTRVQAPRRGAILDRDGHALVTARPVAFVAVHVPPRGFDPAATASALAAVLDVDAGPLTRTLRSAPAGRSVPVITLRRPDYLGVADRLAAIPDVEVATGTAQLAPAKGFAGALLGAVAPATAEQIADSGGTLADGDEIGQWGLEAAFQRSLAGTARTAIVIRSTDDAATVTRVLAAHGGRAGRPLRTTLDLDAQRAAESALDATTGPAALVALQPSTGDVLAVANRPLDQAFDRALDGRYPPGSTFKVVTTAALLGDGLDPATTVPCPPTATVGGRSFKNFEGEAAGAVPFSTDFAQSCNTAFVGLADRLPADRLSQVARGFGLGEKPDLGVTASTAQVPPGTDLVERAAAMIGQARLLASPLAMAGVAATVADGRWRAPRLLAGAPGRAAAPIDPAVRDELRALMRQVVTSGTGTALASLPGEVAGKSGTAEYGSGDPPPTHAWFIAYRGDLALAVLVEDGASGGTVAAPIAARFLGAYP
jgi:cell division protein FtsI/penicillin-binding protein 2